MSKLFAALVLALASLLAAPDARAAPAFEPQRFTVEVQGTGADVILIPGLASSRAVWSETAGRLKGSRRLHLVQIGGFAGQAAGPNSSGPLIGPIVEELHRYIVERGLKRPAIVGHSLGGLIGLMLAKAYPQDVGRLMVVDALPFYGVLFSPQASVATIEPIALQARDAVQKMAPEAYAAAQAQGASRYSRTAAGQALVRTWAASSSQAVVGQATYDDLTTDLRADLAAISAPVTVLYAWDAAMGPAEQVEGIYRTNYASLPGVRLVRIEGAFHFLMLDQPEAFARELDVFLK
jgi:pimeloyl-ACP methyl ester carboxylesterase